jgi:hypothetical protein
MLIRKPPQELVALLQGTLNLLFLRTLCSARGPEEA